MTLPHPLASASKRNERKALLYAKWVSMGSVAVCFDATAAEVAVPEQYKESIDIYFTVSDQDTKILPNGLEGVCAYPNSENTFDFFISWGAIHGLFSHPLNEKHVYFEDLERAHARAELRKIAKSGKVMPS